MKLEKLILLRNRYGFSQKKMADILGITQAYYSQLENGNKKLFYGLAKRISAVFGLKPDDIFYPESK